MKTRADLYKVEAAGLLRDITMYRALTEEQLLRLYPGKREKVKNLLAYLTKQGRIYHIDGLYCAAPECAAEVDRGLLAAVWVLTDFIEQVDFHSSCDFPTKLVFFADGAMYEVIHAAQGKEVLISHILSKNDEETPRYLVLVDNVEQIEQLQIPCACGYCTVSPEGDIQYYQKE